jgi:hypothetical protein
MNGKIVLTASIVFAVFACGFASLVAAMASQPGQSSVSYYYCTMAPRVSNQLSKYDSQDFTLGCYYYSNGVSLILNCGDLNPVFGTSGIGTATPTWGDLQSTVHFTVSKDFRGYRYLTFYGYGSNPGVKDFSCRVIIRGSNSDVPSITQMGAPQLFSLQGLLNDKSGKPISTPVPLEVKICEPPNSVGGGTGFASATTVPGSCCPQATLVHDETFQGANDDKGRFNVLVGGTDPLQLLVNTKYNMQLLVNGEIIKFGGSECTTFESAAGPGPFDSLEGPIAISKKYDPSKPGLNSPALTVGSDYGTALAIEAASCRALAVEGTTTLSGDTVAQDVYANSVHAKKVTANSVDLVNYSAGWIGTTSTPPGYSPKSKSYFLQIYSGSAAIPIGSTIVQVNLPPEWFVGMRPCTNGVFEWYATASAEGTDRLSNVNEVPVVEKTNNIAQPGGPEWQALIIHGAAGRTYDFTVIGGYNCPANSAVQPPAQCIE